MKKELGIRIALAAAFLAPTQLMASETTTGNVTQILTASTTGLFYFMTTGSRSAVPTCATNANWVVNIQSAQGQAVMNTVMAAKIHGKFLAVFGTGSCPNDPVSETVNYVVTP